MGRELQKQWPTGQSVRGVGVAGQGSRACGTMEKMSILERLGSELFGGLEYGGRGRGSRQLEGQRGILK